MKPYVSLADVVEWVDESDYVTAATGERGQFRGEWRFHRGDEPSYTLRSSGVSIGVIDEDQPVHDVDRITELEYQRESIDDMKIIQTFPESYELTPDTKGEKRRLMGNAVPPMLAESVAEELRE